jgi:hypothetical protein
MNISPTRKAIEAAFDEYRNRLDTIPEEQFTETPPGGGWSYAEVYSHILQADLGSCVAMERCINGTCGQTTKGLNMLGRLVLFFGRFPPVKIKVPEKTSAKMPALKISKEEARNLLIKCRKKIEETVGGITAVNPKNRYKHPRLGNLNAGQWLKFILVHTNHHIKQLDRIENKFLKA